MRQSVACGSLGRGGLRRSPMAVSQSESRVWTEWRTLMAWSQSRSRRGWCTLLAWSQNRSRWNDSRRGVEGLKKGVRLAFLWWQSGFVDALEASGDAVTHCLIHVSPSIDVGIEAAFLALAKGLELDAQRFNLVGIMIGEFGPAESVGAQAELGGVEEVAVLFSRGKEPISVGVDIGDWCWNGCRWTTGFGGWSTTITAVPVVGASTTIATTAASGHGKVLSLRGEGIGRDCGA